MKFLAFCIFLLSISYEIVCASKILFLFPTPSKSHLIVVDGLSTTLAERGHDVTVISPFPMSKKMKNYRDIVSPMGDDAKALINEMVSNPNESMIKKFPRMFKAVGEMGTDMMDMPEFKKIMRKEKFDLVIIGMFFNNYLLGVGDHFKCPTMMLSVNKAITWTNLLFGNPFSVSVVPHMRMSKIDGFKDRVFNFVAIGFDLAMVQYMNYLQKSIYE
jgi:glucuronosyltransferase